MKDIVMASSVLILALLVLRQLFKHTISCQVQYALWALVAVRLLMPVSLPALSFSVLNAEPSAPAVLVQSLEREVYVRPVAQLPASDYPSAEGVPPGSTVPAAQNTGYSVLSPDGATVTTYAQRLTVAELLGYVWKAGIAVMAGLFLVTNLLFRRKLRKYSTPYRVEGSRYPVFLCDRLPSPCLFGLFRPAIYLTPTAVRSPDSLCHIMAHEETHARHFDHLWSLLRCVCLSIYWFNPLVWAAAAASKTDCELACDEGALRRLGDGQRLDYGQTLLSLIPVQTGPNNPLLSATAMTSGKRQLKDRITRIAVHRKTAAAALLAVAVLVLGISACTFTNAKDPQTQPADVDGPTYFNETFFNDAEAINIRNQFLSSLYDSPEDINLSELFYCGIPEGEITVEGAAPQTEEELQQVYGDTPPDCPTYKLTTAEMDALLVKYTGLTVAQTNGVGLDHFTYLPEYDAYYWAHGDTNYRSEVSIYAVEQADELLRLYYEDNFMGGGWKCITLRKVEDGYHFVSNQLSEQPIIPTVLPERDPILTIPLDALEPYQAPGVVVERHTDDCLQRVDSWAVGEQTIRTYHSTDGNFYAAVVYDSAAGSGTMRTWDVGCFLTLPEEGDASVAPFSALFGHDGVVISYEGLLNQYHWTTFYDYYYVTDDAVPVLLARTHGPAESVDLDGDGAWELVSDSQIFFQKNDQVYEADLPALLADAWPEMSGWDYAALDSYARCLTARGYVAMPGWQDGNASFQRHLYFDGDSLLVYTDGATEDHVLETVSAPDDVLEEAKRRTQAAYQSAKDGAADAQTDQSFDDWRISSVNRVNVDSLLAQWPDLDVDAYVFHYEFHSAAPETVGAAGGASINEDGWFGGAHGRESPYLIFQVQDGQRVPLEGGPTVGSDIGSPSFRDSLAQVLAENGLIPFQAAGKAQAVMDAITADGMAAMNLIAADGIGGGRYVSAVSAGNGYNYTLDFGQTFTWADTESVPAAPLASAHSLKLESLDATASLQSWQDSELVLCTWRGESFWLLAGGSPADAVFDGTLFSYLRLWYDEVELLGLRQDIIIPDAGQSRQEIAQAWVDAYEGAMLHASPGSAYACTYVKSTVSLSEGNPSAALEGEQFSFQYSTVFLPENDYAAMRLLAGNTADYDAQGGDAPDGAMEHWRMGSMTLTADGWYCGSVGTG